MRGVAILAILAVSLAGCQTTAPVNRPCGVLTDSLRDVQGKRRQDVQRIDRHNERGVSAGCWTR